jgi:hypothetical protein
MAGADFHDFAVIMSVGVGQYGLRVGLLEHLFQIGEEQAAVELNCAA